LRYPTLKTIYPEIAAHAQENGLIVLSGIKNFEVKDLLSTYTDTCFDFLWKFEEKGWSSLVMAKIPVMSNAG
jgi:ribosomal protein L11 methylase PrmA